MPAGPPIRIRVLSAEASEPDEVLLPLHGPGSGCTVRLRCLPGATGLQVVLTAEGGAKLRAELPADGGEVVAVQVELDEHGELQVWNSGRDVLFLPAEDRYDPLPPILPAPQDKSLDLVFVIDGTVRHASREEREGHYEKLLAFAERIAEGPRDCRAAVIAFGDQPPPTVTAADLLPQYLLFPGEEERRLQPFDSERLRRDLFSIPSTSGGDFVDALADALDACARLRWRDEARKLLVLSGDSPGHSVLQPLRRGADVCVRERDVDTGGLRLHRLGVEMVTIHHDPPARSGLYDLEFQRDLLLGARSQYTRLASLLEYAFLTSTFDPAAAAAAVRARSGAIGRGASLGGLVEVLAGPQARTALENASYHAPGEEDLLRSSG